MDRPGKLRGESSITDLCLREGINPTMYYKWSKAFLEAGKRKMIGDTIREAGSDEINELRAENEALATQAIMKYFTKREGKNLIEHFDFYIIRLMNPDGFIHGFNGCNAKQINFYWDFDEKNKKDCPEAFYLWKFAEKIKPSVYFDFYDYTFQLHKKHASPFKTAFSSMKGGKRVQ